MRIRKTRTEERGTYIYKYKDGNSVEIRPEEEGVTEMDIKLLHSLDDSEIYYELKNSRPARTKEDKKKIEKWKEEYISEFKTRHGYEPNEADVKYAINEAFPANYNLSIDYAFGNDIAEDKLKIIAATAIDFNEGYQWSEQMEKIRTLMSEKQREVIDLKFIEGLSQKEIADRIGISKMAVTKRLQVAYEIIRKNMK